MLFPDGRSDLVLWNPGDKANDLIDDDDTPGATMPNVRSRAAIHTGTLPRWLPSKKRSWTAHTGAQVETSF